MRKISILFAILFISSGLFAQKNFLELDLKAVVNYQFWPNSVWGINSMNDGEHYTAFEFDRNTRTSYIVKYEYKTGKAVDTLVNLMKLDIGWVSWNYSFNSDESKLLLFTESESIYRHSFVANFYVYDLQSKKLTKVSENGKQQVASFSPNGEKVAFVRNNNIFIKDLSTMSETQITTDGKKNAIINGIPDWVYEEEFGFNKAYHWSPDGNYLAYVKFDESKVKEFTILDYAGMAPYKEENKLYPGLYTYKYPKAGEDNSVVSVHLYNVSEKSTKNVELVENNNLDFYVPRIFWHNNTLIVEKLNRAQNELKIITVNPETATTNLLFTEKNKYYVGDEVYDNIVFLEDNEHIIVLSEQDGYRHLYLYNVSGTLESQITKGNWDVIEYLGYNAKKNTIYYSSTESSPINRDIYSIKLNGKKKRKLNVNDGTNSVEFSNGFKYYILSYSDANTPGYITLNNAKGQVLRVLEDNETLKETVAKYGGVNKEFFKFKTSENVELNAYKIVPPDFDNTKKYPVIITQYSGPNSQRVLNSWSFGWENYLAQNGIIIIGVDTRGTGGRGEEFRKITYKKLGKYETLDLIETAKYAGGLAYVDKERIGIWGWSYGGFMVLNAMTKGNGVFKAGVSVAPVTNWRYYDNIYTERYMGKPQDNPDGYDKNSPLNFAENLQGELLLAFGTADDNVHPQNSYEFIAKSVEAGKQFLTFPYPNRNHSIRGGNTSIHLYQMKTNFFFKHLLNKEL